MAAVNYNWLSNLERVMNENSDPVTKDWLFMKNPAPLIALTIGYLCFVCRIGPQYMKGKTPYNLKTAITIYNTFQILCCLYLIYNMVSLDSFNPFECKTPDYLVGSESEKMAKLIWWTTMLKITEYIETIFFVLRKKQNQVSVLHLFHHVSTLSMSWLTSKFTPIAAFSTPIVINSFIHVLMYSYYLIALHGGKKLQKKIVLWKRSLTILQMIQFTIMIIHILSAFRSQCQNQIPKILLYIFMFNIMAYFFMFYRFYKKTYDVKKIL